MQLSDYLKNNEIKVVDFARQIEVSKDTVYKWLSGKRRPQDDESMQSVFEATKGEVTANDFYGISCEVFNS